MTHKMVWDAIGGGILLATVVGVVTVTLWLLLDGWDRLRFWLRECAVRRQIRRDRRYTLHLRRSLACTQRTDTDYIQPLLPPRSYK